MRFSSDAQRKAVFAHLGCERFHTSEKYDTMSKFSGVSNRFSSQVNSKGAFDETKLTDYKMGKPKKWDGKVEKLVVVDGGVYKPITMYSSAPEGAFRNPWDEETAVVKDVPIEQLYHMRGMYGLGGPRHRYDTSDSDYMKFRDEKRKIYGDDLFYSIDDKEMFEAYLKSKEKELEDKGFTVLPPKVRYDEERGYGYKAYIPYRWSPKKLEEKKEEIMQPFNTSDLSGKFKVKPEEETIEGINKASKVYIDNMAKEIAEGKGTVPIIGISQYDVKKGTLGEGRHRILAAQEAGLEDIPVAVELVEGEPVMCRKPYEI